MLIEILKKQLEHTKYDINMNNKHNIKIQENQSKVTLKEDHNQYSQTGIYLRDDHCDWGSSGMNEFTNEYSENK